MSLVQAIASELDESDELILAIDMADARRARDVRNELRNRGVRAKTVGYAYPVTEHTDASPAARRLAGQLRARFFASLSPDVLLICSLFEYGTCFSTELDWSALGRIPSAVIGYDLIPLHFPQRYLPEGAVFTDWYHERIEDLQRFDLILSISESTKRDHMDQLGVAESRIEVIGAGFDETLSRAYDGASAQQRLRELGITKPFVLTVGNGDWRKNTLGALQAFANLPEPLRLSHELVLTQAGEDVLQALENQYAMLRDRIHILGKVDDATLALLYSECRVFYFPSYYEGFGFPVLEALAFNAAVITSNAGALPEVVHDSRALFEPGSHQTGVQLLMRALADDSFREEIRRGGHEHALTFTWSRTARRALNALRVLIERRECEQRPSVAAAPWPGKRDIALMAGACLEAGEQGEYTLEEGLSAIARRGKRRILVDITEIVRLDAQTGIQRVTRQFLSGLASIAREKRDFDVEPICWTENGIRYIREYARNRLGIACTDEGGQDEWVQVQPSDLVFMLDSSWWSPERFDDFHARVHEAGGEVVWMVYDLIPIRFPQTCDPGMPPAFRDWLRHAVRTADGFVCISEATRNDLEAFMNEMLDADSFRPWTRSVRLGCDLSSSPEMTISAKGAALRSAVGQRPYFVGLGTVEPRKDYATVLSAFERLWSEDIDVALVIIGKPGWNVDSLVTRINQHPEIGRRLHWLQGASDGDVRQLLGNAAALIQASIWEGFGLPLIEAGSLGVPLLVTDIAVFHEIAGDGAVYFPVGDECALADAVAAALNRGMGRVPAAIPFQSWKQASTQLLDILGAF